MFCFNGATSFQKWIEDQVHLQRSDHKGFQWGHFFSEMDRRNGFSTLTAEKAVSMGPLLFRNG